ncbi:MAG: PQQ-binding-like beta-propeller repeat protein [Mariniblastus sp.]
MKIKTKISWVVALLAIAFTTTVQADDWAQFRGTGGVSVGNASLPKSFDNEKNIAWKIDMPGKGASSPIVVGDKIIVTCSGGEKQDQLYTVCVDAASGKKLWTQKFWATGRCFVHPLSANAAPTPASDGKHVFVFFSSNDLACLDLDGNLVWYRGLAVDHPKAGNDVGMASSPAVKDGVVVVQVECQGDSFATGLDVATGKTLWTNERAKDAVWTSPLIVDNGTAPPMVVLQSKDNFNVLDLKTGKVVYNQEGAVSSISSPAIANGKLFVPIDGTTAFAISSDGQLTKEWNSEQIRPSSMSSVIHDNKIYTLNRAGALSVFSSTDGTEQDKIRVIKGGSAWATPVVSDDHMYFFAQGGQSYVVNLKTPSGKPEVVHEYTFEDEVFLGSPAVGGDGMYIRSDKSLWKIAN